MDVTILPKALAHGLENILPTIIRDEVVISVDAEKTFDRVEWHLLTFCVK